MKRPAIILWAIVLTAVTSPVLGAIVYSGSQNVVLSLGPMTRMDSMTIDLASIPTAGDWDDFKVSLWWEPGMPGALLPSPGMGMGMGTRLAIYAPSGMGMGMGMGGILGLRGLASNVPMGGAIGVDSFFDVFAEMTVPDGSGEFGEGGGYLGLRTAMGQYGWLHMLSQSRIGTDTHQVVFDGWAYEEQPGVPIAAGQGPACDWVRGRPHKMHWPQLPDLSPTGIDISLGRAILADDFKCTATGPIRDIHLWGSFLSDIFPDAGPGGLTLELRIYTDVPATATSWSRPGDLKWRRAFKPGEYTWRRVYNGEEDWYDPANDVYLPANHRYAFQYNFCIDKEPFAQEEGKIYWLAVKDLSANPSEYTFGWKTTAPQYRWNDDAAFIVSEGAAWREMNYPKRHKYEGQTLDQAFVITNDETVPERDLGDAPDSSNSVAGTTMQAYPPGVTANYPTVYQAGSPPYGPRHWWPRKMFYLGKAVSLENEADVGSDEDGVNNLDPLLNVANQDGADDGLVRPVSLPFCEKTSLDYVVTVADPAATSAYVNVWCDWNRDGDWNDTLTCPDGDVVSEWAVQNDTPAFPGAGTYVFTSSPFECWHPTTAGLDPIWVRITISEQRWTAPTSVAASGGAGPVGGYRYGETEDYYIQPRAEPVPARHDWGDAPDGLTAPGYPVLAVHNGARHVIAGPWLGGSDDDDDTWGESDDTWGAGDDPDSEGDGQPDAGARGDDNSGDDDEDGVSIPRLNAGGASRASGNMTIQVSGGGGVVQAWIDFDGDKVWEVAETIFDGFLPDGVHVISFPVPTNAVIGKTFARVRISTAGGLAPDGPAGDGEVEDHEVEIVAPPVESGKTWCQYPDLTPHGIDIRMDHSDNRLRALADDFECRSFGERLVHLRFWGSWKDDEKGLITKLRVRIHPDDPVGPEGTDQKNEYSKPGPEILWEGEFGTGQFTEGLYHTVHPDGEWWWDPVSGAPAIPGGDTQVWQIDLDLDPEKAFVQEGTPDKPRIYWLALEAETERGQFGWKTRQWPEHFMDDAVWDVSTALPRTWHELRYPFGHRYFDHEKNSIDLSFCLLFSKDTPPPPTILPGAVTTCPAVATTCPAVLTACPPVATECPASETQCPPAFTKCPPAVSLCQPAMTQCQALATQCPPVLTECPATFTECPATATECEPVPTRCPAVETQCPAFETRCPSVETGCPMQQTVCPTMVTKCPPWQTRCPPIETECPMTETECPLTATTCPAWKTRCPPLETKCPPVETRCPPVQTECPRTMSTCIYALTLCPPAETRCPAEETKCPPESTKCPPISTTCPVVRTECPTTQTVCPPVETKCPPVETECPTVSTSCPPALTRCPPKETVCPATMTQCLQLRTTCPLCLLTGAEESQSLSGAGCPTVDTDCPSVGEYLRIAQAR